MKIWLIDISADDGDTAIGPCGLYLGMSAENALNLFRCDNPDAIEYLQTGDENLLTQNGELPGTPLYDLYEDEDHALTYVGSLYLSNKSYYQDDIRIEERRVILNYEVVGLASLHIDVTDGIISEIEVEYWNLN